MSVSDRWLKLSTIAKLTSLLRLLDGSSGDSVLDGRTKQWELPVQSDLLSDFLRAD